MENYNEEYDINDLRDLIIKSLDHYDSIRLKYTKHLSNKLIIKNISEDVEIVLDNEIFRAKYQILGYHDFKNNIWIWGWLTQQKSDFIIMSKELLNYGLKLDPSNINAEQLYLKTLLLNSRYIVDGTVGLDINLSIFSYILKEKILFIYPLKNNDNKITIYYIIY